MIDVSLQDLYYVNLLKTGENELVYFDSIKNKYLSVGSYTSCGANNLICYDKKKRRNNKKI